MEGLSFSQIWLIKKMWKDRYVKLAGNLTNRIDRQADMSAYTCTSPLNMREKILVSFKCKKHEQMNSIHPQ